MTQHNGSCLCGKVSWQFSGEPHTSHHCHCAMCRKAHGAAFGTYYFVSPDRFQWTGDRENISRYASSPDLHRAFCTTCGSVVPDHDHNGKTVYVPAGSHDHGPPIDSHIFVNSKAPWHEITDELPQHGEYDPDAPGTVYDDRELAEKPADVVARGSCLCGAVAFEVTEPFKVIHNCHCSRCRRARSAAFTTNGFTSAGGTRFTRGEEHVRLYKVPDARFFTHAFCDTCGSGLPRIDPERKIAAVPLGALDDDPGQGPVDHIFIANRADWYEPGDDLPRFEQGPG
jgi:hypothetical protein